MRNTASRRRMSPSVLTRTQKIPNFSIRANLNPAGFISMSSGLHRYSQFVMFSTFLLILAGGLVTSTGSGLSVPDWPLSYGQVFPPMIGGIRFEHTHRLIAGFVGCLTLILAVSLYLKEKRTWVKWMGLAALLAVIAQAVLGGLTVIYLLPTAISVLHSCF